MAVGVVDAGVAGAGVVPPDGVFSGDAAQAVSKMTVSAKRKVRIRFIRITSK